MNNVNNFFQNLVGVFLIISGLAFITQSTFSAIVFIITGIILIHYFRKNLEKILKTSLSNSFTWIIGIIGFVLGTIFLNTNSINNTSNLSNSSKISSTSSITLNSSVGISSNNELNNSSSTYISSSNSNSIITSSSSFNNFQPLVSSIQSNISNIENKNLGINITRDYIISRFTKLDDPFVFKEGELVKGEENFISNQKNTIIQLIGPSNNLKQISLISLMGDKEGDNLLSLVHLAGLSNIIDSSSSEWIQEQFKQTNLNKNKDYNNTKIINGRIFEFNYSGNPDSYFRSYSLHIKNPNIKF